MPSPLPWEVGESQAQGLHAQNCLGGKVTAEALQAHWRFTWLLSQLELKDPQPTALWQRPKQTEAR